MKKTPLLILGGILLVAAGVWWFWPFGNNHVLRLSGIVEIQEVRLGSKAAGRVYEILVKEGDIVCPGQPLVMLEAPEWIAQKKQWQAQVKAAEAELERSRSYRQEEKDETAAAAKAAEVRYLRIKESRPLEIRQAENEWKAAEAERLQAEVEYERISDLYFRSKSVSKAEYDTAVGSRDRTRGRAEAAKARWQILDRTHDEDVAEAKAEWDRADAKRLEKYNGPREEDRKLAEAKLDEARAKLAEIEVFVNEAVIRAPDKLGKARVEVVAVRPGDLLPANAPALRVLRVDDWWVKVFVPETKMGHIRDGQEVDVSIDTGKTFKGVITEIANIAEFTPRNVQSADERRHQVFAVKVRVENPGAGFHAGMAAAVVIPLK